MTEIARSGKWNPGGGRWLELLPLALLSSGQWTRIYCSPETLLYRDSASATDNGKLHTTEIKGYSPDDSPAKAAAIESFLSYEKCLARFCDNQGLVRLAGTASEPLSFSYELTTDTEVAGSRGYSLALSGTLTTPPTYA